MGVEAGHFIDLGHAQAHFLGQGAQVRGREMAIFILNQVQEFDQQVAVARAVAQKRPHLGLGRVIDLAAFRRDPPLALARFPDALAFIQCHACLHSFRQTLTPKASGQGVKNDRIGQVSAQKFPRFRRNGNGKFRYVKFRIV